MTLADISTVTVWLNYFMMIVFAAASIILLSGHGSRLIATYNMTSKKERETMDSHLLSKHVGYGIGFFTLILTICIQFQTVLPLVTAYVFVI